MARPGTTLGRLTAGLLVLLPAFGIGLPAPAAAQDPIASDEPSLDRALDRIKQRYGAQLLLDPGDFVEPPDPGLVTLGRELFFSTSLSGKMDVACVSCHHPFLGGGDGLSLPVGESAYEPALLGPGRWHDWRASGDPKANGAPNVARHSPTTFNSALYRRVMFFDGRLFVLDAEDGGVPSEEQRTPDSVQLQVDPNAGTTLLASQARFPVVSPQEMLGFDFAHTRPDPEVREALVDRLRGRSGELPENDWLAWFREAYGAPEGTAEALITFESVQDALAAYQASQIFIDNDWNAYVRGNGDRLDRTEKWGAVLFFSAPEEGGAGCAACHSPPTFSDERFHNIAMPQFGRGIQAGGEDFGRRGVTQKDEDRFRFRTPGLLNVAKTGPYGHTGAFSSLRAVIEHHLDPEASIGRFDFAFADNEQLRHVQALYANAERLTRAALDDLEKKRERGTSLLPSDLALTSEEIEAIERFLLALTDPCLEDRDCLSRLIPDGRRASPDGNRLVATFARHGPPPRPLAGSARAGGDAAGGDEAGPRAGSSDPVVRYDCGHGLPGTNDGGTRFDEVALEAGLSARHEVSWELYEFNSAQRVLFSGGIAAGDIDGDCWPDIYHPTGDKRADVLYRNRGNGAFEDVSEDWGIVERDFSNGAALVDLDGDGDLDLVTTNLVHPELPSIMGQASDDERTHYPTIYRNEGQRRFSLWTDLKIGARFTSWSFAFGDYDADGDLDALSTHWRGSWLGGAQPNHLWKNNGAERDTAFSPEDGQANLMDMVGKTDFTFTGAFSDIDLDGYPDILMASDFESSRLYRNEGDGRFANVTGASQISDENGMGAAVSDYDNDGDLDWFVSSVWDPNGVAEGTWGVTGNRLYRNDGGVFRDVTETAGVAEGYWGWGACFADFNNDAWPDLFHVNGFDLHIAMARHLGGPAVFAPLKRSMLEFEKTPSRLFISDRNGGFVERSADWGIADRKSGRGVVCFDYDRDGDVDILVSNHQDRLLLYRNNARSEPDTNFVNISLKGTGKNSRAIGAKVYVSAGGVTQLQEMQAGGSFLASAPQALHFGLGGAEVIDEVRIVWPRPDYTSSVLKTLPVNRFVTIEQPGRVAAAED